MFFILCVLYLRSTPFLSAISDYCYAILLEKRASVDIIFVVSHSQKLTLPWHIKMNINARTPTTTSKLGTRDFTSECVRVRESERVKELRRTKKQQILTTLKLSFLGLNIGIDTRSRHFFECFLDSVLKLDLSLLTFPALRICEHPPGDKKDGNYGMFE